MRTRNKWQERREAGMQLNSKVKRPNHEGNKPNWEDQGRHCKKSLFGMERGIGRKQDWALQQTDMEPSISLHLSTLSSRETTGLWGTKFSRMSRQDVTQAQAVNQIHNISWEFGSTLFALVLLFITSISSWVVVVVSLNERLEIASFTLKNRGNDPTTTRRGIQACKGHLHGMFISVRAVNIPEREIWTLFPKLEWQEEIIGRERSEWRNREKRRFPKQNS